MYIILNYINAKNIIYKYYNDNKYKLYYSLPFINIIGVPLSVYYLNYIHIKNQIYEIFLLKIYHRKSINNLIQIYLKLKNIISVKPFLINNGATYSFKIKLDTLPLNHININE